MKFCFSMCRLREEEIMVSIFSGQVDDANIVTHFNLLENGALYIDKATYLCSWR